MHSIFIFVTFFFYFTFIFCCLVLLSRYCRFCVSRKTKYTCTTLLNVRNYFLSSPTNYLANKLFDLVCYISFDLMAYILCKSLQILVFFFFFNRPHRWRVLNVWANEMNIIHNHYAIWCIAWSMRMVCIAVPRIILSLCAINSFWWPGVDSKYFSIATRYTIYERLISSTIWVTTKIAASTVCMHDFVLAIINTAWWFSYLTKRRWWCVCRFTFYSLIYIM